MNINSMKVFIIACAMMLFGGCMPFMQFDTSYKGRVVDADTGEPIEGAAVAVEWAIYRLPFEWPDYCDTVETVTDKDGHFKTPWGWCLDFWPMLHIEKPSFHIYKPGFDSYPPSLPKLTYESTVAERNEHRAYTKEFLIHIEKNKVNLVRLRKAKDMEEREYILRDQGLSGTRKEDKYKKAGNYMRVTDEEQKLMNNRRGK